MDINVQSFDRMLKAGGYPYTGDSVVEELRKALSTDNSGPGGIQSGPLMLQNLDAVMTEVLITEQHFKLYNMLPKVPSAQPYYEYNVHLGFGSKRGSLGFGQGGAPKGGVSAFQRKGIYNKFLGVKGGVTHQMLVTGQNGGAFEDPTVRENRDRTLEMLERLERELIHGKSTITDENGVEVNMDGLIAQLTANLPGNIIDMKGKPFSYDQLDDDAEYLVTTGKQPSVNGYTALMSPHVSSSLNKMWQQRNTVRNLKGSAETGSSFIPGFEVPKYDTQFGTFQFDYSILLQEVEGGIPVDSAPAGVPASPATPTGTPTNDATSLMDAGTYYYSVAACNDTGESLPTISAAIVCATGQNVTLAWARLSGATSYRIYRGKLANGTDAEWIGRIPQSASAPLAFVDANGWRTVDANGAKANGLAIEIKPDPKDIAIAQMTPLIKMPLPQVDTTYPFLLLLYIVAVIKAPQRVRIYKNCGTYTPAP